MGTKNLFFYSFVCFSAPSGPPRSFRVVAISSTSIRLTWSAPLPEEQNGRITSYRITITELEGGVVLERTARASDSLLIVDSLRPYFTYQCSIAAFTIAIGPEATADVTTLQTGKAIHLTVTENQSSLYLHAAPDGSPRNATVAVLDSSSVECRWLPPLAEDVNGDITGYIIRVTGQDTDEMIELTTNETNILVENLHPFYSYAFTAAALTEAGLGPFASVTYFQMLTAGMVYVCT